SGGPGGAAEGGAVQEKVKDIVTIEPTRTMIRSPSPSTLYVSRSSIFTTTSSSLTSILIRPLLVDRSTTTPSAATPNIEDAAIASQKVHGLFHFACATAGTASRTGFVSRRSIRLPHTSSGRAVCGGSLTADLGADAMPGAGWMGTGTAPVVRGLASSGPSWVN